MADEEVTVSLVKNAGIALIVGGLFCILRVVPMRLSEGVTGENFPPQTVDDIILFAQLPVWEAIHALGIVAVIFLIFGVTVLTRMAQAQGQVAANLIAQIGVTLSLILFSVALVSDGLILPMTIENLGHMSENGIAENGALIEFVHTIATSVGGYSAAVLLLSGIFLGITLIQAFDAKIFGSLGVVVGFTSILGYATGMIELDLSSSFKIVGPLTMFMFLYLVAIGIMLLRMSKSISVQATN